MRDDISRYYDTIASDGEMVRCTVSPSILDTIQSLTLMDVVDVPQVDISSELVLSHLESVRGIKDIIQEVKKHQSFENKFLVVLLYLYYVTRFTSTGGDDLRLDANKLRVLITSLLKPEDKLSTVECAI